MIVASKMNEETPLSFNRMYRIHDRLAAGGPVGTEELARMLSVSPATVKRDVRRLRTEWGAPIVFRRVPPRGYTYPDGHEFEPPLFGLDQHDLLAVLTAVQVMQSIRSDLLRPLVAPLERRLRASMRTFGIDSDRIRHRFSTRPLGARRIETRVFRAVVDAVARGRAMDLRYHARSTDAVTRRRVDCQQLVFHRENWYLLAWCRDKRDLRLFACDRLFEAVDQGPNQRTLTTDQIAEEFAAGFGIFLPQENDTASRTAVLRFTPERARWVADEEWHPDQVGTVSPNGSYTLRVPFTDARELVLEILRHGDAVEVLDPADLRQTVADQLQRAAEQYETVRTGPDHGESER